MSTSTPELDEALAAHRAGRLPEAAALYERLLEKDAANPSVLHLLGVLRVQERKAELGAPLIERAIELRPDAAAYHSNLGNARRALGDNAGAMRAYRHALELDPQLLDALSNLGAALRERGELVEARAVLERAYALQPRHAAVLNNLAATLDGLGQNRDAVALFRCALALDPRFVDAAVNLARALAPSGGIDEAIAWLTLAVGHAPEHVQAHMQLALALKEAGRAPDAVELLERFLARAPGNAVIYTALGMALTDAGRLDEVEPAYRKAHELDPNDANAVANLGVLRVRQGRFAEALEYFERSAAMDPGHAGAHNGVGTALGGMGRYPEAAAAYRRALECDPRNRDAHLNLGLTLLTLGEFEEGWREYEARLEYKIRSASGPRWRGEELGTLSLLVFPEQGAGDNIHFIRYFALLREEFPQAKLVFPAPDALRPLFKAYLERYRVEAPRSSEVVEVHGFQSALLSVPAVFGTDLDSIPAQVPYLFAPEVLRKVWARRLGQRQGLRVGVCWAGNPSYAGDAARSIALEKLSVIFDVPGVEFFNLQKGADLSAARGALVDHMEEAVDFAHTAALIEQLDLVISVDTSIAHLAGALAKPVWLLNRVATDWRWLLEREDSPWYPTMRIYRQSGLGEWGDVLERVRADLLRRAQDV